MKIQTGFAVIACILVVLAPPLAGAGQGEFLVAVGSLPPPPTPQAYSVTLQAQGNVYGSNTQGWPSAPQFGYRYIDNTFEAKWFHLVDRCGGASDNIIGYARYSVTVSTAGYSRTIYVDFRDCDYLHPCPGVHYTNPDLTIYFNVNDQNFHKGGYTGAVIPLGATVGIWEDGRKQSEYPAVTTCFGAPPPAFSVSISGPSELAYKQSGTWTAVVSGGTGNYAYQWYKAYAYATTNWIALGTANSQGTTMVYDSFTMRCDVHDNGSNQNTSGTRYVAYSTGGMTKPNSGGVVDLTPAQICLLPAYPNPFNPSTRITFGLPGAGDVTLVVYDVLGRKITTLVEGSRTAGYYTLNWDGTDEAGGSVSSGIYFVRLIVQNVNGRVGFSRVEKVFMAR